AEQRLHRHLERRFLASLEIVRLVREPLIQLRREAESGASLDASHPRLGDPRVRNSVEGRVDLDGVEVLCHVGETVEPRGLARWIDDAVPVVVRPAGDSDSDHGGILTEVAQPPGMTYTACHSSEETPWQKSASRRRRKTGRPNTPWNLP